LLIRLKDVRLVAEVWTEKQGVARREAAIEVS